MRLTNLPPGVARVLAKIRANYPSARVTVRYLGFKEWGYYESPGDLYGNFEVTDMDEPLDPYYGSLPHNYLSYRSSGKGELWYVSYSYFDDRENRQKYEEIYLDKRGIIVN